MEEYQNILLSSRKNLNIFSQDHVEDESKKNLSCKEARKYKSCACTLDARRCRSWNEVR